MDSNELIDILSKTESDKIQERQNSLIPKNLEESKKEESINPHANINQKYFKKEGEILNSNEPTKEINIECQSPKEFENLDSIININDFRLILEKTERVVDVSPLNEKFEDKKEEMQNDENKQDSNNNQISISNKVNNNIDNDISISNAQKMMDKTQEHNINEDIIKNQVEEFKNDIIQNPVNEIPSDIKTTDLTEMQEYKLYYNYLNLHMVKVAKYLEKDIIIICNEIKNEEPNFFYQAHYIFIRYKLYKF